MARISNAVEEQSSWSLNLSPPLQSHSSYWPLLHIRWLRIKCLVSTLLSFLTPVCSLIHGCLTDFWMQDSFQGPQASELAYSATLHLGIYPPIPGPTFLLLPMSFFFHSTSHAVFLIHCQQQAQWDDRTCSEELFLSQYVSDPMPTLKKFSLAH